MVSYSEIERHLWPDVNVDTRHGIKEAAQKMRMALGSDAYRLQCLRGRGYRLMAAAMTILEETSTSPAEATPAYGGVCRDLIERQEAPAIPSP